MKVTVLGSGSGGNATLVETSGGNLYLIDVGFSAKEVARRMEAAGHRPEDLSDVILTHGHTDHAKGWDVFQRRHKVPGPVTGLGLIALDDGSTIRLFPVPHDAEGGAYGVVIRDGAECFGLVTDAGHITKSMKQALGDVTHLCVEMNHDLESLWAVEEYADVLKERISGPTGHLSNDQGLDLVRWCDSPYMEVVVGMHVSQRSNDYDKVQELLEGQLTYLESSAKAYTARQDEIVCAY